MNSRAAPRSDLIRLRPRKSGDSQEIAASQECGRVQFGQVSIPLSDSRTLIEWRIGYRRWQEFDAVDGIGQDSAALRGNASYLVGIVADGVSQSFYGDIAAAQVTRFLIHSFWERRQNPPSENEVAAALKPLEDMVDREFVGPRHLPSGLYPMQREALEEIRKSGSQAVFSAFILDIGARRLSLYQVGDVDAVVHIGGTKSKIVRAQSAGRWSSAGKSSLLLAASTLDGVTGLVLRSDGMGDRWGLSLDDGELDDEAFSALSSEQAAKDDLSFVSFCFQPPHTSAPLSPEPVAALEPIHPTPPQKVAETRKPTGSYLVREPPRAGKLAPAVLPSRPSGPTVAPRPGGAEDEGIWLPGRRTLSRVFLWVFIAGLVTGFAIGWEMARGVYARNRKQGSTSLQAHYKEVSQSAFIHDMKSSLGPDALRHVTQGSGAVSVTWPPNWHGSLEIWAGENAAGNSRSFPAPGNARRTQALLPIPMPTGPGETSLSWRFNDMNGIDLWDGLFTLKSGKYYEIIAELHEDR
jgi:hypothetical protein